MVPPVDFTKRWRTSDSSFDEQAVSSAAPPANFLGRGVFCCVLTGAEARAGQESCGAHIHQLNRGKRMRFGMAWSATVATMMPLLLDGLSWCVAKGG